MAAIEKYTDNAVLYRLRHNSREHPRMPGNREIAPERTCQNQYMTPPEHGRSARDCKAYYDQRLQQVYRYGRADVKTAYQWVVTAPEDVPPERYEDFFREAYGYLNSLYGERNCIQSIVHYDEGVRDAEGNVLAGRPHMHYLFIPVVKNNRYNVPTKVGNLTKTAMYPEKVCADQLINRKHLQMFHPGFQRWMDEHGLPCTVHSGVTGGNNRTVAQLKLRTKEQELDRAREQAVSLAEENSRLRADKEIQESQTGWGAPGRWGKEAEWNQDRIY